MSIESRLNKLEGLRANKDEKGLRNAVIAYKEGETTEQARVRYEAEVGYELTDGDFIIFLPPKKKKVE